MKISTVINLILLGILTAAFSGCGSNLAQIDDTEAFYYIKKYEAENQQIIANNQNEKFVKWIQAANKKEACKLWVGYSPNDDRTLKNDYKIFWDGECKNGYAYGLGREFERGFLTNLEAIGLYSGGKKEPEYFIQKNNLENTTQEGDITNGNFVITAIKDDGLDFNINYMYLHNAMGINLYMVSSPFTSNVKYVKEYSNFLYIIEDVSNYELGEIKYTYNTIDKKNNQLNGFGFTSGKDYVKDGVERVNGKLIRPIYLPKSYIDYFKNILNEIVNAAHVADEARIKALMVKQQYKDKICKDSVKVDFIDNKEYKAICNDDTNLKTKIDMKLAQIRQQKQIETSQIIQALQIIQAREVIEQNKIEAENARKQQTLQRINQNVQNINNNVNMQRQNSQLNQINNNLNNINNNLNNINNSLK